MKKSEFSSKNMEKCYIFSLKRAKIWHFQSKKWEKSIFSAQKLNNGDGRTFPFRVARPPVASWQCFDLELQYPDPNFDPMIAGLETQEGKKTRPLSKESWKSDFFEFLIKFHTFLNQISNSHPFLSPFQKILIRKNLKSFSFNSLLFSVIYLLCSSIFVGFITDSFPFSQRPIEAPPPSQTDSTCSYCLCFPHYLKFPSIL